MTKRMLINATQPEQMRIALVEDNWLYDLDIETQNSDYQKANIYKGKVTRIERSLEAAFVDYGGNRHGFLPFREVVHKYNTDNENVSIQDVLSVGDELIVQIDKEERGNKGAALTTSLCLAGCYVVLMPNNPKAGGISRRVEGDEREELKEILNALEVPEGMGLIVRTAGVGCSLEELQWDLNILVANWKSIQNAAKKGKAPFLIYKDSDIATRSIREHLKQDIDEIIIDNNSVYRRFCDRLKLVKPDMVNRVKLYNDALPLFTRHSVESQIQSAFRRDIRLPSGGSIVIDHTEALVSIDINSSKATKAGDIEQTATQTNLEAADEIARQLRLRDLGGLIVIDFIDMAVNKNQRQVEQRLKTAVALDRARIQIGRISRFGLLEMSRQRLKSALADTHGIVCPRCNGQGMIDSLNNNILSVIRNIESEAINHNNHIIRVELPIDVITHIINDKRSEISRIEKSHNVRVVLIPNTNLRTPHHNVEAINLPAGTSLEEVPLDAEDESVNYDVKKALDNQSGQKPAVNNRQVPQAPAKTEKRKSLIKKIWSSLVGSEEETNNKKRRDKRRRHHNSRRNKGGYNRKRTQSTNKPQPQQNKGKRTKRTEDNKSERSGNKKGQNKNKQQAAEKTTTY